MFSADAQLDVAACGTSAFHAHAHQDGDIFVKICPCFPGCHAANSEVRAVIEVAAAALGASISVLAMAATGLSKRSGQSRDAMIKLTVAVDNVAKRLDTLHIDIKADRMEIYGRLRELEASVARLEGAKK